MYKLFIIVASFSAATSVAFGAFGAHALKSRLDASQLSAFQTAVQYQMVHALALLAVGILLERTASTLLTYSGFAFIAGAVCFSGSLYLLTLTAMRWPGPVTPIGGLFFIVAWCLLGAAMLGR